MDSARGRQISVWCGEGNGELKLRLSFLKLSMESLGVWRDVLPSPKEYRIFSCISSLWTWCPPLYIIKIFQHGLFLRRGPFVYPSYHTGGKESHEVRSAVGDEACSSLGKRRSPLPGPLLTQRKPGFWHRKRFWPRSLWNTAKTC